MSIRARIPILDRWLGQIAFVLHAVCLVTAPWVFGAWEMWHFWPFATLLFLSFLVSALRIPLESIPVGPAQASRPPTRRLLRAGRRLTLLAVCSLPFLVYAGIRYLQAPVHLDAERQWLLILMPSMIFLQVLYLYTPLEIRRLFALTAASLGALGLYGLINHVVSGNRSVMWLPGFPQYVNEHRATGSYFCPDHFAGIMEFAFAAGVALLLGGRLRRPARIAGIALILIGALGILLSKSRGGGLALAAMSLATIVWGFYGWPRASRWWWRFSAVMMLAAGAVGIRHAVPDYSARFLSTFGWEQMRGKPLTEAMELSLRHMRVDVRVRMWGAAWRAWQTDPWTGIGLGMHRNLWPHFAPSPDGDRAAGRWPRLTNNSFHSYEVHNDWLQLLEELGVMGFVLFLIPAAVVVSRLESSIRRREPPAARVPPSDLGPDPIVLCGFLCLVAMAVHSLTDFNLQMPATNWIFSTLVALALAATGPGRVMLPPAPPPRA